MTDTDRTAELARQMLKVRRLRHVDFPDELFDEHAWDMILALFVAMQEGSSTRFEAIVKAASANAAAARRWLDYLVATRRVEMSDGDDRDPLLTLTRGSIDDVERFFVRVAQIACEVAGLFGFVPGTEPVAEPVTRDAPPAR